MQIRSIKIRNFRCYFGQHEQVRLDATPAAHVVLVYGENMRGKTSLLQAIRWCLYGRVVDRRGSEVPYVDPVGKEQLLNMDAEAEEDCVLEVELQFEHDGQDYVLRRRAEAEHAPANDEDFLVSRYLSSGTEQFAETGVDARIQNMLSEDVSRFFLFDAEMLEEYEELLKSTDPEQEAAAVKQAIEKILGLPALRLCSAMAEQAEEAEEASNKILKKRAKHNDLVETVARLQNRIKSLKHGLSQFDFDRNKLRTKLADAQLAVSRNTEMQTKLAEVGVLEQQTEREQERREKAERAAAGIIRDVWWLPLVHNMQSRLTAARQHHAAALESLRELLMMEQLEKSAAERACVVCGSQLDRKQQDAARQEANRLKLENFGINFDAVVEAARRAEVYERFSSVDAVAELKLLEETIAAATASIAENETRIRTIRSSMTDRARGDWQTKLERFNRLQEELRSLDDKIREQREELSEVEGEHSKKQRQLNNLPDADPALALEASAYRELSEVFEEAVDEFRDDLRETVGKAASEIFRELTTERDFSGLQIDENYGLALLDGQGRAVPGRSAGAEQIVALSLIGGLNASAVREGPVVMDSNFARLDTGHRENVLRFLPHLGKQVIVLAHSGEIEKERDLRDLGVNVARKYEVVREGDTRSRIEEL